MARTESAWRCSQCGAINEAGSRSCHECGKWPSLFDLQESVEELPDELDDSQGFEPDVFEPEVFEAEPFEAEPYETGPYETGTPAAETSEPDAADGEEGERRSRFPRWAITAIWVIGIIIWFVANALGDRG